MNILQTDTCERAITTKASRIIDLAKLAHDLKGPLNSIKGLLVIAAGEVDNKESKRYFRLIEKYQQLLYSRIDETLNKVNVPEQTDTDPYNLSQIFGGFRLSLRNIGNFRKMGALGRGKRIPFSEKVYQVNTVNNIMDSIQKAYFNRQENKPVSIDLVKLAHDIKGPLNSIKGLLDIAKCEVESEAARNYFTLIEKCQQQLFNRVEETLKRASEQNSNTTCIDFATMVDEIQSSLEHMDGFSDIEFKKIINTKTTFFSDADALYSIIQNLMENAIKYRKHDSSYHVVILELSDTPDGIELIVSDNGMGIKEELFSDIFKFRVRDENTPESGHGIGLALVKQLTERLGGQIILDSEHNQGTTFTVKIPNSIPSAA